MTLYYITITGVNRKLPQPQSATRLPPPEGGGLRSGAVHTCNRSLTRTRTPIAPIRELK